MSIGINKRKGEIRCMKKKLPKEAYGGVSGKDYVPYFTGKSKKWS